MTIKSPAAAAATQTPITHPSTSVEVPAFATYADDQLLTIDELAAYLRVPVATVRNWREKSRGPAARMIGRSLC
ncbi:helix-turn-helix domain-containing protein [Curtobacterium sp. RRHDQ10]|uniref:helix-turn-helix domain-containing protein n=1 Tax=Curtobacterium phyllosphaerae TaxID=3413379 RepID=UPI003BF2CA92